MADFDDGIQPKRVVKLLFLGDSGTGKTGALAALAAAGYNVRILDLDQGAEVLGDYLTNPLSMYRKAEPSGLWTKELGETITQRLSYVTITDTSRKMSTGNVVQIGDGWAKVGPQLDHWYEPPIGQEIPVGKKRKDFGNVGNWTDKDVLVIDSLTALSRLAFNYQLGVAGHLETFSHESDYYAAQEYIRKFLTYIHTPIVPCHVVVICHVEYMEREDGQDRGFPASVGKALSPRIPREWNHMIRAHTMGVGSLAKRTIQTATSGTIDLKSAAPLRCKPEYPLSTGLLQYFKDVLSSTPTSEVTQAPASPPRQTHVAPSVPAPAIATAKT